MYALNDYGASPPPIARIPTAMRDTLLMNGVGGTYQTQQRIPDFRRYEIKDHLGNVRTVIADYKNPDPTYTSSPIQFWRYFADVRNISNMYPYGKLYGTNAIYNAEDDYRYGFNGMEKAKEVDDNTLTSKYRNADLETGNWWSRDPKESEAPSKSPYIMMGNNPIVMIDPNGDKEYATLETYQFLTGYTSLGPNDWLRRDREIMNEVFTNACEYNLLNRLSSDYTEINQRYSFYKWFSEYTNELGFETRWAGAAYLVAYDVEYLTKWYAIDFGASDKVLSKFANEGNEAIFVDVFPKLRNLYMSRGLIGEEAENWDNITLAEEQNLVQPLYIGLPLESKELLAKIIYGNHWTSPVSGIFTLAKKFPAHYELFTVSDRWKYGMDNMFYDFRLFTMPDVSDYYKNGGSSPKSGSGGGKLDTPLEPAGK